MLHSRAMTGEEQTPQQVSMVMRVGRILLPLGIVLALGLGVLNLVLNNRLVMERARLENERSKVVALNAVLASPGLSNVILTGSNGVGGRLLGAARLQGVLALTGLPANSKRAYLINLTRKDGGLVDSIQAFTPDSDGTAHVVFAAPMPWAVYIAVEVVDQTEGNVIASGRF